MSPPVEKDVLPVQVGVQHRRPAGSLLQIGGGSASCFDEGTPATKVEFTHPPRDLRADFLGDVIGEERKLLRPEPVAHQAVEPLHGRRHHLQLPPRPIRAAGLPADEFERGHGQVIRGLHDLDRGPVGPEP